MVFGKKKAKPEPDRIEFDKSDDEEEEDDEEESSDFDEQEEFEAPPAPKHILQRKPVQEQKPSEKSLTAPEWADLMQGSLERLYKNFMEGRRTFNI